MEQGQKGYFDKNILAVVPDRDGTTLVYYDNDKKYFFQAFITGCAHEGIYREYFHISKAETIQEASERIKEIEAGKYSSFKTPPWPLPIAEIEALEESPDWEKLPLPSKDLLF